MSDRIHPNLDLIFALADSLGAGAQEFLRAAQKRLAGPRRKRGGTLRPGTGAPLWGALAEAVLPYLQKRGERAKLARWLGLDDARLTEFFVRRSAMPDAERTLLLLQWLALRRRNQHPG